MLFSYLSDYLKTKAVFTTTDLLVVEKVCHYQSLAPGENLVQPGDLWQHNAFVCRGLAREYYIDDQGNEKTVLFAPENHWTGDRESSLTGNPATLFVEALAPTDFILIQRDDFQKLCVLLPPFSEFMDNLIQRNISARQQKAMQHIATAEEKVAAFIAKYPTVTDRTPLQHIASFLEIRIETLEKILLRDF